MARVIDDLWDSAGTRPANLCARECDQGGIGRPDPAFRGVLIEQTRANDFAPREPPVDAGGRIHRGYSRRELTE